MPSRRAAVERGLDLFVYAPLGLLVATAERLPEFAEQGRRLLNRGEVDMAAEARSDVASIVGYDALSARELMSKLEELDTAHLRAALDYEVQNRNRRTVIGRIEQLLQQFGQSTPEGQ